MSAERIRIDRRDLYSPQVEEYLDGSRTHLFVVPARGGEPKAITAGDCDVREPSWSPPEGREIAFVANRPEGGPGRPSRPSRSGPPGRR